MIYPTIYIAYLSLLYLIIGLSKITDRYKMYLSKEYWTDYNIIEAAAWMAKAIIIIPGLIFGIELWYMHFLTLATSSALIWASMRKSLPTLILFNTIWICISLTIIIKHLYGE
jgi:hypothetical protein